MDRHEVRLAPGQRFHLSLPGLGTAGYAWTAEVEGDRAALHVRIDQVPQEEPLRPGASTSERVVVEALAPGRAIVHLRQARPWEGFSAAVDERILEVTVAGPGPAAGEVTKR